MQSIDTMVIPAAGYGTRMQGITCGRSKELLEIGNKPALLYALEAGLKAGITRVGIVIRKGKEDIVATVQHDPRLSQIRRHIHIVFFYQKKPSGEAGAILEAMEWIGDTPFLVHYPDNIIIEPQGALNKLIDWYKKVNVDLVLLTSETAHVQTSPCGLESLDNGLYRLHPEIVPPGYPHGMRTTGIYVATFAFLQSCRLLVPSVLSGEIKDRDIRRYMTLHAMEIYGVDISVRVLDIGNPSGYRWCRRLT